MMRKGQATWQQIKGELLRRIKNGEYGSSPLLPSEPDMAAAFGVARATMNRVMRELADEGIVERKRKGGTRVLAAPLREARFRIPIIRAEIEQSGKTYGYRLLSRALEKPPLPIAARLNLVAADKALHLTCLHLADGHPFQLEDRWINTKALPEVLTADFSKAGPNEWLVSTVPYTEVEISFSAEAADAVTAALLDQAKGAALFVSERTTWWRGEAITSVKMSFAGGYRMMARY